MILSEEVKLENGIKARIESEIDVKAYRFPKRSEMREFGKVYNGKFAEKPFAPDVFPYRKN